MNDCKFCELFSDNSKWVYVNKIFAVKFDRYPVSSGHALIIPKRHIVSVFDLCEDDWYCFCDALCNAKIIIESVDAKQLYQNFVASAESDKARAFAERMLASPYLKAKPDGYNVGNNDGIAAGRTIHHLHFHVIPRYFGDVANPVGGVRRVLFDHADYQSSDCN